MLVWHNGVGEMMSGDCFCDELGYREKRGSVDSYFDWNAVTLACYCIG